MSELPSLLSHHAQPNDIHLSYGSLRYLYLDIILPQSENCPQVLIIQPACKLFRSREFISCVFPLLIQGWHMIGSPASTHFPLLTEQLEFWWERWERCFLLVRSRAVQWTTESAGFGPLSVGSESDKCRPRWWKKGTKNNFTYFLILPPGSSDDGTWSFWSEHLHSTSWSFHTNLMWCSWHPVS